MIKEQKRLAEIIMQYYNLWSFLYFKYFKKKNVNLLDHYRFATEQNFDDLKSLRTLDVLDGVGWICVYVATIIFVGFVMN